MGEIIEFPSRVTQEWAEIDQVLRKIFTNIAAPVDMQDEVLSHMKEFFHRFNVNFSLSFELPANLSKKQRQDISSSFNHTNTSFEKQLHEYTSSILLERVQVEIELYTLRHDKVNM